MSSARSGVIVGPVARRANAVHRSSWEVRSSWTDGLGDGHMGEG